MDDATSADAFNIMLTPKLFAGKKFAFEHENAERSSRRCRTMHSASTAGQRRELRLYRRESTPSNIVRLAGGCLACHDTAKAVDTTPVEAHSQWSIRVVGKDVPDSTLALLLMGEWTQRRDKEPRSPHTRPLSSFPPHHHLDASSRHDLSWGLCSCLAPQAVDDDELYQDLIDHTVTPVVLNVYSVGRKPSMRRLNHVTRQVGGVFHAAVQVHDKEYSFGGATTGCGIMTCTPRRCPLHTFRESVYLGDCDLPADAVQHVLHAMRADWPGEAYDLLHNNCCTFCNALVKKLGVPGGIPNWVDRFARFAAVLDDTVKRKVTNICSVDSLMAIRLTNVFRRRRRRRKEDTKALESSAPVTYLTPHTAANIR